jgi:S1-C subfamily serine protease
MPPAARRALREAVVYPRRVNVVDLVLLLLVLAAAIQGLRVGALTQLLTFGGFWLGLALGILVVVGFLASVRPGPFKIAMTLLVVLGLAVTMGVAGRIVGSWSHATVKRLHLGSVDNVLGVMVAVVAALVSAWLVASVLSQSRFTWVTAQIQRSDVLKTVDEILPPVPSAFAEVEAFLSGQGFPSVFVQLSPPIVSPATVPSTAAAQRIASGAVGSTVKVIGPACGYVQEGTGFVVGPHLVMTNAHVIAGESAPSISTDGTEYPATPVYFDPSLDLAILRTDAPLGPPLELATDQADRGASAAIVGYPNNGNESVQPAGIAGPLVAEGRDIYNRGLVVRKVYEIDASVQPGNSGSPLITDDGKVVGVVFSRSTAYNDVGYALASPALVSRLDQATGRAAAVSTGGCVQG